MPNKKKDAGKGMRPIKGYNPKNWYANYDQIDWSDPPEIVVRIDKNTIGYLPLPSGLLFPKTNKEKDDTNDRRTEEISGSNG
jgi:hypothetical protein